MNDENKLKSGDIQKLLKPECILYIYSNYFMFFDPFEKH